ncbi:MAG: hypothetical protein KDD70_11485 [Bdellovibrionales bacterium]|nr:hypothetical protein [Bdellovibrionales bacterium]
MSVGFSYTPSGKPEKSASSEPLAVLAKPTTFVLGSHASDEDALWRVKRIFELALPLEKERPINIWYESTGTPPLPGSVAEASEILGLIREQDPDLPKCDLSKDLLEEELPFVTEYLLRTLFAQGFAHLESLQQNPEAYGVSRDSFAQILVKGSEVLRSQGREVSEQYEMPSFDGFLWGLRTSAFDELAESFLKSGRLAIALHAKGAAQYSQFRTDLARDVQLTRDLTAAQQASPTALQVVERGEAHFLTLPLAMDLGTHEASYFRQGSYSSYIRSIEHPKSWEGYSWKKPMEEDAQLIASRELVSSLITANARQKGIIITPGSVAAASLYDQLLALPQEFVLSWPKQVTNCSSVGEIAEKTRAWLADGRFHALSKKM